MSKRVVRCLMGLLNDQQTTYKGDPICFSVWNGDCHPELNRNAHCQNGHTRNEE